MAVISQMKIGSTTYDLKAEFLKGLGRKTSVATIALNPSVDTGFNVTWHISDSTARTNDATNSPSFDAGIINVPWDWGGYNGQIAIQNTVSGNTRMQIRSATSVDNGENASPRYSPSYGAWREVVTATKATAIGSDSAPVYISNTGQATAISSLALGSGSIWAGTDGNTAAERQVGVRSGSGSLYMYATASTTGNRGLYVPAHGTGAAKAIIQIDTNNSATFNGNASSATSASSLTNFKVTTSTNLWAVDSPTTNAIGYQSGLTKAAWNYQQTDGAIYDQFYSANWIHQIFGDYRTGQISVRGKNNGTWQAWRRILDETNYSGFADNRYLKLSGGTLTGALTISSGNLSVDAGNIYAGTTSTTTEHYCEARSTGGRIEISSSDSAGRGIWIDGGAWVMSAAKGSNIPVWKGRFQTSFKNSIAMGSYGASATTVPDLCTELRYSSGAAGSANITTAYTLSGITVPTGWYNFLWIPHRSGGVDGAASDDNCNYGTLLLTGMTVNNSYRIRYSGSAITTIRNLDNITWGTGAPSGGSSGDIYIQYS